MSHLITSEAELDAIYGPSPEAAIIKELDHISDHYRRFIEASPFMILATSGPEGLDCSPRGDPKGFVRVADRKTLMIPDRRGNNRVDSLRNIVRDPRVGLLFLVPGVGETMRVNGRAALSRDPELCRSFEMQGKTPACVIVVTAESVYPQCQKALVRSKLWDPKQQIARSELPTVGEMMQSIKADFDGRTYDANYPERLKQTIY
ncbi:MAG: pyridoxamine 5'-phosphate oxidase family protein [Hyphomicrobiaceae bacterium]|nr:pyridoxamine 5'-phosphate oxidase family protein [Hyphomicrobiaceae bacterium]